MGLGATLLRLTAKYGKEAKFFVRLLADMYFPGMGAITSYLTDSIDNAKDMAGDQVGLSIIAENRAVFDEFDRLLKTLVENDDEIISRLSGLEQNTSCARSLLHRAVNSDAVLARLYMSVSSNSISLDDINRKLELLLARQDRSSKQWLVSPTGLGDFTTIGEAIHHAQPYDDIVVADGNYMEALEIEKPISIYGQSASAPAARLRAPDDVIRIGSNFVTLRNLHISTTTPRSVAILVARDSRSTAITHCHIESIDGFGIVSLPGSGVRIAQCHLLSMYCGIRCEGSAFIKQCYFGNSKCGILALSDAELLVEQSSFANNDTSLEIREDSFVSATSNRFDSGTFGVVLDGNVRGYAKDNTFSSMDSQRQLVAISGEYEFAFN